MPIYARIVLLILFLLAVILLAVRFWPSSNANEIMNTCVAAGETNRTGAATTTAQTSPPLYLGLDAYRHLDKLSYLELGDRVEGASTADPGGSNADNTRVVRSKSSLSSDSSLKMGMTMDTERGEFIGVAYIK